MVRVFLKMVLMVAAFVACGAVRAQEPASEGIPKTETSDPATIPSAAGTNARAGGAKKSVMVIPVREAIDEPVLYILRRGLKEAIEQKMDMVILDMDTPGGSLGTTFEILEALEKFSGQTVTFVNKDAISAGAFIAAATHEIHFAPNGVIGAAAPVSGGGQDIDKTMKAKVVSYLKARIRSISEGKGYRGEVISAMIDEASEFKIGERVLKKKDELLSLTATEANEQFGEPPQALLASGISKDIEELLTKKFGADAYTVKRLEVTWSEQLAQYLNAVKPILLGLGLLAVFIEFKTPGFGVFGILGGVLLGIVFLGSYVAGLSGHEPIVLFAVGVLLVALELFLFPGVVFVALTGVVMMLGSLVWAMADLWPNEPVSIAWSGDAFVQPMMSLGFGVAIAIALGAALLRFMPRGWFWDRMIIGATIDGSAQVSGGSVEAGGRVLALVGRSGVAATDLRPGGQVEIDGERFEARVDVGSVRAGARIVVRGRTDFSLIVEEERA
jgi:membrane-bound serine protease (ClpP class)